MFGILVIRFWNLFGICYLVIGALSVNLTGYISKRLRPQKGGEFYMDMSIDATIGFTTIAAIGIIIVFLASCKKK